MCIACVNDCVEILRLDGIGMSGDHNMNQTDSGWRKRQIALDIKAENARKLGLDYEPDKTIMEMAREAGWMHEHDSETGFVAEAAFKFAELVRADEREACAKVCDDIGFEREGEDIQAIFCSRAIRARGQA